MAAGLKVCSASHCTGFLRMGSGKVDAGLGEITGFPLAGRVNGPITHEGKFCPCTAAATKIPKIKTILFVIVKTQLLAFSS
jgi:hypothetical protein